ncbi:alpha/beta hydrolase [Gordonia sp. zg691]|uniref:Alpha/beta hydrolase n=1 Tax=Gordonia jinghuaiqii TaxID=2758710 RepID=A0A7D7LSJ7_9ACTN|nr:alpha/beta hydrolase [Gordonia jinghuaiqii]MBD0861711.1 alpha/beta hydrolase [Gordonia jinghuaiqii]MCR5977603.1 alpha/beta fold hydrolase [Gordonia jinghuaiqii]QMT02280.1 alpha/beta hydrolase [Gordonia jinghuaiqii]
MTANTTADAPEWFRDAVATPPDFASVTVDGARITYRCWGEPGAPGLLLVHGGAAHSGWWDHIAPRFAPVRRVVALDLSGHGDSGWRTSYSLAAWADEIAAVAAAGRAQENAVLVGHSLGGLAGIRASLDHPGLVGDLMVVDSHIVDAAGLDEIQRNHRDGISRADKHYPSKEAALQRYRLVPDHASLGYAKDHVAEHSVVRDEHGWRWKFDRGFADEIVDLPPRPPRTCRLSVVYGEHGVMTAEMARQLGADLDAPPRIVELSDAGHHIPLEQPLELMAVLDEVLREQSDRLDLRQA